MKIYNQAWVSDTYRVFGQSHPRVVQVNLALIQSARQMGIVCSIYQLERAIEQCLRIPALGKFAWSDYKSIVKRKTGFTTEEMQRLFLRIINTHKIVKDELLQLPLFIFEN